MAEELPLLKAMREENARQIGNARDAAFAQGLVIGVLTTVGLVALVFAALQ